MPAPDTSTRDPFTMPERAVGLIFRDALRAQAQARSALTYARRDVARARRALSDAESTVSDAEKSADEAQAFVMQVWDHYRDALTRERVTP